MRRELLIGCGSSREKRLALPDHPDWEGLTTLDYNGSHDADVVWDLLKMPLPFDDDSFDEIHAYEVLEHTGAQGDWKFFFAQWSEFWRIMKPDGVFFATVPAANSPWAWGDPSHTRVLPSESLIFLNQPAYEAQVGKTPMSDFRFVFRADFDILHTVTDANAHQFLLRAVKPSRIKHAA